MLPTAARRTSGSALRTSTSAVDAARAQPLRGHRADAPERVHGELLQERLDPFRRHHRQAVGLLPAGRDLRQELVRRDARRRRETRRLANRGLQPLRHVDPERLAPGVLGDVEIRLVERERLDERRDLAKDREHLLGDRSVLREVRRARSSGRDRGGRRGSSASPIGRRAGAPRSWRRRPRRATRATADRHRPAAQLRPIALLDRRVERVHVDVDDASDQGIGSVNPIFSRNGFHRGSPWSGRRCQCALMKASPESRWT